MAGEMRLCEHPDFRDILIAVAAERDLSEQIAEKDYYVTEALRIVAGELGEWGIFKGGTSLSKGWGLIQRFSEDIDLFVNPTRGEERLSSRGIDRELKRVHERVAAHPALILREEQRVKISGKALHDRYGYTSLFSEQRAIAPQVLLESGVFSGEQPTETRELVSYAGEYLQARGLAGIAEDTGPFPMRLLHFRRTFVEKLFAIHARVRRLVEQGSPLGPYARHYYDLYCLAQREEVRVMLQSPEYGEIRTDYDRISRQAFPRDYVPPPGLSFQDSTALFPEGELKAELTRAYEAQCAILCFGAYPPFADVVAVFEELRPNLG
jgi:hypothetical protein